MKPSRTNNAQVRPKPNAQLHMSRSAQQRTNKFAQPHIRWCAQNPTLVGGKGENQVDGHRRVNENPIGGREALSFWI